MLPWGCGQREHRVLLVVDCLKHEPVLYQALNSIEFEVVCPFACGFLLRAVSLGEPIVLPLEIGVVVHIKGYVLVQSEGERQDIVALNFLRLYGTVIRG